MSSDINVQTFSGKVNITSNLLVGSSHLFVDTQNNRVGLITNTPAAGLHVESNTYVRDDFRVGSGIVMNDTSGRITAGSFVGDGSAMTGINSDSGSWVNGVSSNVHLATIGDSVGIGVVDPQYKLDINGTTQFRAGQLIRSLIANNVARPAITDTLQQYEIRASAGNPDVNLASGHGFLRIGAGGAMAVGGYISYIDLSGYSSVADMKQNIVFGTSSAERMRITHDGNVGIGTTSPGQPLDVQFTGDSGIRSKNTGSSHASVYIDSATGYSYLRFEHSGAAKFWIQATPTGDLAFRPSGGGHVMDILNNGNVGIGTSTPYAKLHVVGTSGVLTSGQHYGFASGGPATDYGVGIHNSVSIYGNDDIVAGNYVLAHAGTMGASDERIKKEIVDAEDGEALSTLRLLKPKQYKYRDEVKRGIEPVWGFIAQEVRDTLSYATQLRTDVLPNIYELANVSSSNVITFTNFNTSNLESNATTLIRTNGIDGKDHDIHLVEVIDEHSIRLKEDLSAWTGSVDENGNIIEGDQIFVYGQEVDDFIFVKKDAIWTVATAALQEVDRKQQADKARITTLEARILALENA